MLTHEKISCNIQVQKGGINLGETRYTLRELRARKGWTQRETARKLGISEQTYNAWEKDVSGVAVSKVNALAGLFGVKIGEIFFE